MINRIKNKISVWADQIKPRHPLLGTDRAWIEINQKNLEHNVCQLKSIMPSDCELMAVVKAEAYGHGAFQIATHLQKIGVKAFAVATIDEGIHLRHYGITGDILILGYTCPSRAKELRRYNLIQTLIDYDHAVAMDAQGVKIRSHIKIDTGMHRLGFDVADFGKVCNTFMLPHIHVEGIYSHLCVSDSLDDADIRFTREQVAKFNQLLRSLSSIGFQRPKIHIQSSYGLLNYPEISCDYVRGGIALYGVYSSIDDRTKRKLELRPVLSLKSRVISIRDVPKGESVGYGKSFTAQRDSRIAIISIGYADGVPRNLSCGNGFVLIAGEKAPIVGRICMDQMAVDVTDIPEIQVGMVATLIGKDGDSEISAEEMAAQTGTITNEILSRLGQRLQIVIC